MSFKKLLSQRYTGESGAGAQDKYMFVYMSIEYTKERFLRVQGHDFRFIIGE